MKKLHLGLLFVGSFCNATILTHTDYTAGNTITAAGQNANENLIINDYNGSIQGTTANSGGSAVNIQQGSISTPDLRANAVTLSSATALGGAPTGSYVNAVATATITTIGKPVLLLGSAYCTSCQAGCVILKEDGTNVPGTEMCNAIASSGNWTFMTNGMSTPAAGSHTYALWQSQTGPSFPRAQLIVIELRD